jgi:hypothetical protein
MDELDALLNEVEEAVKPSASSLSSSYSSTDRSSYNKNNVSPPAFSPSSRLTSGLSDYRGRTPPSDNGQMDRGGSFSMGGGRKSGSFGSSYDGGAGYGGRSSFSSRNAYKENTPPSTPPGEGFDTPTPRGNAPKNSFDVDDIDDLLGMTEISAKTGGSRGSRRQAASRRRSSAPVNTLRRRASEAGAGVGNVKRGGMVLIGGTICSLGPEPSKFRNVVNDHLLCTKCMCEVVRFEDVEWGKDADYIFFRNYWPDADRLCDKMKRRDGSAAYCCQCSSISVTDIQTVDRHDENIGCWKGTE